MTARLRQVVLTCAKLEPAVEALRQLFASGSGDVDPGMAEFGLTHEVLKIGNDSYVEICAPLDADADTTATRFLRRGGDGGYMAVVEVDSAEDLRSRLAELALAVPLAHAYHGNELTQLHPRDFGTLLEADEIGTGHDWHYPTLEDRSDTSTTTGLVAIDVAVADPPAIAARWAEVFGATRNDSSVELDGGGTVRFVAAGDRRPGVVAFDVAASDRAAAGATHHLGGVGVRFV